LRRQISPDGENERAGNHEKQPELNRAHNQVASQNIRRTASQEIMEHSVNGTRVRDRAAARFPRTEKSSNRPPMNRAPPVVIEVKNLTSAMRVLAVDGIDFTAPAGATIGFWR